MLNVKFSGTIKECLAHLKEELEKSPEKWDEVFEVFSFIRSDNRKVRRWINGEFFPSGRSLIYLHFCFDKMGYQVEELTRLSEEVYSLGKLTYLKGMTTEQVMELLGSGFGFRTIHSYFLKGRVPAFDRAERIRKVIQKIKTKDFGDNIIADSNQFSMEKDEIIDCFIHMMKMAMPFAEALMSDHFSASDRRKVQEEFGRKDFFRLSLLMDGLSSEESRKQLSKEIELKK